MLKNDRFLKALRREALDVPPVWVMRQAGRYLPEYRNLRAQAKNFMDFCRSPELCTRAALQPIDRFDLDAAIVFSDILTIPDAMNCKVRFLEGEGPQILNPIRNAHDVAQLKKTSLLKDLHYVMEAIAQTKKALQARVPLIGFAGSPWTLACYMIEGGSSKTFECVRGMMYQNPGLLKSLLELLSQHLLEYLQAQIVAGADVIMIFDTWGGLLSRDTYQQFSLHYMQKILEKLPSHIPSILFTKGGGAWLELMAETGCTALGIDWHTDLADAYVRVGSKVALQGNLDPAVLYGPPATIQAEVHKILISMKGKPGHIFNLGHGISPGISPEAVIEMLRSVRWV